MLTQLPATTIGSVAARPGYGTALGELWEGLARTLARLDEVAGEPDRLDDEAAVVALRRFQYRLHVACEHAYGLRPPEGAQDAHADLAGALAAARDATADVAEAASFGGAVAVEPLLHEWRGALFGVRLARRRLTESRRAGSAPPADAASADAPGEIARPLAALLLALLGALAFVVGAVLGPWPVWAAGIAAVAASLLVYRP